MMKKYWQKLLIIVFYQTNPKRKKNDIYNIISQSNWVNEPDLEQSMVFKGLIECSKIQLQKYYNRIVLGEEK